MDTEVRYIHLSVADTTLRLALAYVTERTGHRVTLHEDKASHVVTDLRNLERRLAPSHTVVVDPLPIPCQQAVDAIVNGRARSAITSDDPEGLAHAIDAANRNVVTVPQRMLDLAADVPRLPSRLAETLRLVIQGATNPTIATQLCQSESTVKRDIASLVDLFDTSGRRSLVAAAVAAGYPSGIPRCDSRHSA